MAYYIVTWRQCQKVRHLHTICFYAVKSVTQQQKYTVQIQRLSIIALDYFDAYTGDFMKKVPQLPVCNRDRQIVYIERVYTPSTFYMKSSVCKSVEVREIVQICKNYTEKYAEQNRRRTYNPTPTLFADISVTRHQLFFQLT